MFQWTVTSSATVGRNHFAKQKYRHFPLFEFVLNVVCVCTNITSFDGRALVSNEGKGEGGGINRTL